MLESGNINFGKYTLVKILELANSELLTSVIAVDNNCQKIIPADTIKNFSLGAWDLSTKIDKKPKITMFINGRMMLQAKPIFVCL